MQAATILAALQKAAKAPAMAGIYLKSVDLSAVHDWVHDPVMCITWSMPDHGAAIDAPAVSLPGVSASILSRPSDTTMLLPRDLASPDELESAVMGAAWTLGAWDVRRIEHAPLPQNVDWRQARHGLVGDFGRNPYTIAGQPLAVGEAADDVVCELAAAHGWITWAFVPLAISTPSARKRWGSKDRTLQPDCTRAGVVGSARAKWWYPAAPHTANDHIYQLGRGNHGNRSKTSQERRG